MTAMEYLTVSEAAEALQLSVPTIKRYIYQGKLQAAKLPGGQHRIPRSEIDRLLAASRPGTSRGADDAPEVSGEGDRVALLEQWITDLQVEVERLEASLEVVARFAELHARTVEESLPASRGRSAPRRVLVLGPGCRRCRALYAVVTGVLDRTGRTDVQVERVTDLDAIAAFGPVVTPALVVGDRIIHSGRVPSQKVIESLLLQALSDECSEASDGPLRWDRT